jgi:hypothetical protein
VLKTTPLLKFSAKNVRFGNNITRGRKPLKLSSLPAFVWFGDGYRQAVQLSWAMPCLCSATLYIDTRESVTACDSVVQFTFKPILRFCTHFVQLLYWQLTNSAEQRPYWKINRSSATNVTRFSELWRVITVFTTARTLSLSPARLI